MKLPGWFEEDRAAIDAALETLLPPENIPPASIHRAMRYSVFAGGKRIRPILFLETARIFAEDPARIEQNMRNSLALAAELSPKIGYDKAAEIAKKARREGPVPASCALEFIHTYSLIHDDLPALDNDDLRRGKPTSHKVFGEAIAILTGDALLTLAFQTLATASIEPSRRVRVVAEIAGAAGTVKGMVGGQVADLEAEGKPISAPTLEYIHRSKTAALIRASSAAGAIAGGGSDEDVERLRSFGENIGWAFQVVDDILDQEESSAALGKTAGKDKAQQKATYPALYGLEKSREIAADLEAKALGELARYGERAARLRQLAEFLVARRS